MEQRDLIQMSAKQLASGLVNALATAHNMDAAAKARGRIRASNIHFHDDSTAPIAWNDLQAITQYNLFTNENLPLPKCGPTQGYNQHDHSDQYNGGPIRFLAKLEMDGGYDGNSTTGIEASWTYTVSDINAGAVLAYKVPLYGHRPFIQETTPATCGEIFVVLNTYDGGVNSNELPVGINPLSLSSGSGSASGSSGSGSGSGCIVGPNLIRIGWCDEQFPSCNYNGPTGSGSGSGGV